MTPGQNSTLNCDPNPRSQFNIESWHGVTIPQGIQTRGHNSTWNQDPGSQFNVEPWPGVKFKRRILTRIIIQREIMFRGHIQTWNYDPGSRFNVELSPRVKNPRWIMSRVRIPHWIVIPIPGHNLTLDHDSGSKFNMKLRPGVIIQRRIKTRGHNSTGVQILSVGGVVIQWPPVSRGSQFNMENPLNPEHSLLNQDPTGRNSMGSKFNPTPATPSTPRQRSTTCAISVVAKCHLYVINEQVNVYSAETNF